MSSKKSSGYTSAGSNMLLEWPTVDLQDSSIAKVELKFDMMHRYFGSYSTQTTNAYHANNNPDMVEVLARSGNDPSNFGDYSQAIPGKGVILNNAEITDANVGLEINGGVLADINGLDIDDVAQYGVITTGTNSLFLDGLDVSDSGAGANSNYGFYTDSLSAGVQQISNSAFDGLGTAIYLTNDVSTTISSTTVSNSDFGLRVGAQSSANHIVDTMTLSNNDVGISAEGTGDLTMNDVSLNSLPQISKSLTHLQCLS